MNTPPKIAMKDIVGIILAGGQGTRLDPLTRHRSKPAVPFGGRYRIVDFPITNCLQSGIQKIFVLTQFASASLNQHITHTYSFDMFRDSFVDIIASGAHVNKDIHGFSEGTADAVRKGMHHIESIRDVGYGLILAGDQLYRMNFREIRNIHEQNDADLTLGVVAVPRAAASAFGIVKVDSQQLIVDFWEKPGDAKLDADWYVPAPLRKKYNLPEDTVFASMSMYLIKLSLLKQILNEKKEMMDFGKEIIPHILKNYKVSVAVHNGYWEDIGTLGSFLKANLDLTYEADGFDIYDPNWVNFSKPSLLPPSSFKGTEVSASIIADGSRFEKCSIKNSVIGQRAVIREGSTLENTVIMGNDWYESDAEKAANKKTGIPNMGIGQNCTLKNVIIDKNARIGNNVTLICDKKNDAHVVNELYVIRDGVIVVPAKAVLPDGFHL